MPVCHSVTLLLYDNAAQISQLREAAGHRELWVFNQRQPIYNSGIHLRDRRNIVSYHEAILQRYRAFQLASTHVPIICSRQIPTHVNLNLLLSGVA